MMSFIVSIFVLMVSAQDVVEMNITETTNTTNAATAKNEIVQKAMHSAAIQQVTQILGVDQYNAKKDAVRQNVLRKTNLFIPFYTTGALKEVPEGYQMDVNLKLSTDSLKNLLLSTGILNSSTGSAMILPFIAIRDTVQSQSFSWWEEGDQSLILNQVSQEIENIMYNSMSPQGLYIIRPVTFKMKNKLSTSSFSSILDQMKGWAANEGAPLYLVGEVLFMNDQMKTGSTRVKIRLSAYQTSTGREVAEVVRSLGDIQGGFEMGVKTKIKELLKNSSEDLTALIKDFWQKGTFDSSAIKLAITGELNYKDLNNIKKYLQSNLKEIKDMREKLVEAGRVTFDIDFDGDIKVLGQKIKSLNPQGFSAQLVTVGSNEVVWDVKKL